MGSGRQGAGNRVDSSVRNRAASVHGQLYPYEVHIQSWVVEDRTNDRQQHGDWGGAVSTPQIQPISCPHSMSIPRLALACPDTMSATGEHVPGSRCQCSTQLQELDCRCAAELGTPTTPRRRMRTEASLCLCLCLGLGLGLAGQTW